MYSPQTNRFWGGRRRRLAHSFREGMHIHAYTYLHTYINTCIQIFKNRILPLLRRQRTRRYVCTCIYIHTYYTYMHACMHTKFQEPHSAPFKETAYEKVRCAHVCTCIFIHTYETSRTVCMDMHIHTYETSRTVL
jgi:hypothetical protein